MGTQLTRSSVMQKNGSQQSSILAPLNSGSSTFVHAKPAEVAHDRDREVHQLVPRGRHVHRKTPRDDAGQQRGWFLCV
jgi:hypothetical protein